jgi:hypothetical protein
MRKISCKKKEPERNKAFKALRKNNEFHIINNYNGKEIVLNLNKHFLLQRPYKNAEYQVEMERNFSKLSALK